jgi:type I restriction enzyme S subunit
MPEQVSSLKTGIKYKDTPIGKIPVDWELSSLGDLCIGQPEYGANVPSMDKDNNLPRYVRITDITDNGNLLEYSWQSINKESAQPYILGKGDFLFARSGATVGKTYLYRKKDGECAFAGYLIRFKPDPNQLLPEFLFHFTHSDYYFNWVKGILRAGAQPNINAKEYWNMLLPKPPMEEQKKIAEILTTVDEAIEKTVQIIEKTQKVKKGLMQKLLSRGIGHTTFKKTEIGEIPEEWEVFNLGKLTETITKGTTPTTYGFKFTEAGINFVKVESIDENGNFIWDNIPHISEETNNALNRSILREFDILFSIAGALGRVATVGKKLLPANTNQALSIIRLKENGIAVVDYIKYYLMGPLIQGYIKRIAVQSAQANLSLKQVNDFIISLPSIREQEEIVEILSCVDSEIKQESNHKRELELAKKGLMQVLLTGKIRVIA